MSSLPFAAGVQGSNGRCSGYPRRSGNTVGDRGGCQNDDAGICERVSAEIGDFDGLQRPYEMICLSKHYDSIAAIAFNDK